MSSIAHSSGSRLLVTGASGKLGRSVLDFLLAENAGPIIATTRNPDHLKEYAAKGVEVRRADFAGGDSSHKDLKDLGDLGDLSQAFSGADRALLISTEPTPEPDGRLRQHLAAVKALEAAGVQHVVYTSLTNPHPGSPVSIAPDHRKTEEALAASSLGFTILRNNLYIDLLLLGLPNALATGKLVNARGDGKTAFITREDCARVAAAALTAPFSGRRTLEITGSEPLSSAEVAAIVSELAQKPLAHVSAPPEVLRAALVEHKLPPYVAEMLVTFDIAIAKGEFAAVTNAFEELTGRAPQKVRDFLESQRLGA
ncbi:SDR family oxidoreductase [Pendulispora albinea]|uniref:SDR family oxidoreductase n=1 Tax=Pendulispora albinea TaxID=2741071 RepID=A0ABZ2M9D4_9BACT